MVFVVHFVFVHMLNGHQIMLMFLMDIHHVVVYQSRQHLASSIHLNVEVEQQSVVQLCLHEHQLQQNFVTIIIDNSDDDKFRTVLSSSLIIFLLYIFEFLFY